MSSKATSGQSCKTCKWLDVPLDKIGRRIVSSKHAYHCIVPEPKPVLPDCIFVSPYPPPMTRQWMMGNEGTECVGWEKL